MGLLNVRQLDLLIPRYSIFLIELLFENLLHSLHFFLLAFQRSRIFNCLIQVFHKLSKLTKSLLWLFKCCKTLIIFGFNLIKENIEQIFQVFFDILHCVIEERNQFHCLQMLSIYMHNSKIPIFYICNDFNFPGFQLLYHILYLFQLLRLTVFVSIFFVSHVTAEVMDLSAFLIVLCNPFPCFSEVPMQDGFNHNSCLLFRNT